MTGWVLRKDSSAWSYRGADKNLARPWKETKLQRPKLTTLYQDLRYTNKSYIVLLSVRHKPWYTRGVLRRGHSSLFPSRVGLGTYQKPSSYVKVISLQDWGKNIDLWSILIEATKYKIHKLKVSFLNWKLLFIS